MPFGGICHGSNPCRTAMFRKENENFATARTDGVQVPAESENQKANFPIVIRHRKVTVTLRGKRKSYPFLGLVTLWLSMIAALTWSWCSSTKGTCSRRSVWGWRKRPCAKVVWTDCNSRSYQRHPCVANPIEDWTPHFPRSPSPSRSCILAAMENILVSFPIVSVCP